MASDPLIDIVVNDEMGDLNMGSPAKAEADLADLAARYRSFRQPFMGTAAEFKKRDAQERETLARLSQAAMHWLWHREHAASQTPSTTQQQGAGGDER